MDPLIEFPELQRLVDLRMAGWKFIARHDACASWTRWTACACGLRATQTP
jgi:hypothetical protein